MERQKWWEEEEPDISLGNMKEGQDCKKEEGMKEEREVKFYPIAKAEGWLAYSIHNAANVTKLGLVSCALTVFEVIIKTHRPWTQPIYTRAPATITWSLAWLRSWTFTIGTTVSGSQGINCSGACQWKHEPLLPTCWAQNKPLLINTPVIYENKCFCTFSHMLYRLSEG